MVAGCEDPERLCSEGRFKEAEVVFTQLLEKAGKADSKELALLYNNRGHARWTPGHSPSCSLTCSDQVHAGGLPWSP